MAEAILEHVNMTASDPARTADRLCSLFGWRIRWQGDAISGGHTIHVGGEGSYIAIYTRGDAAGEAGGIGTDSYSTPGGLNHIGIVVDDLDAAEARVLEAGYETFSHADYEPGRRFYFRDEDKVEFEVVSYQAKPA